MTGGIHGDEATSIVVLKDILPYLEKVEGEQLHGTVIVIPTCNPEAFRYTMRASPADSQDLNRIFPGDPSGTATERIAASIWNQAKECDYVFDLHGCGTECYPYILLHKREIAIKLVKHIPHRVVVTSHGTGGQLFVEALENNIPSAILEIRGGNGVVDLEDRTYARKLIRKLLENTGFLEGDGEQVDQQILGKIEAVHAQKSGVFLRKVTPGDGIEKGEVIGTVDREAVQSPVSGRIIKIRKVSMTFLGENLAGIAPFKERTV